MHPLRLLLALLLVGCTGSPSDSSSEPSESSTAASAHDTCSGGTDWQLLELPCEDEVAVDLPSGFPLLAQAMLCPAAGSDPTHCQPETMTVSLDGTWAMVQCRATWAEVVRVSVAVPSDC